MSGVRKDYGHVVKKEIETGTIGPNASCEYYPCHFEGQDCTWCYCPFYPCMDPTLGKSILAKDGEPIWSCQECYFVHRPEVAAEMLSPLRGTGPEGYGEVRSRSRGVANVRPGR